MLLLIGWAVISGLGLILGFIRFLFFEKEQDPDFSQDPISLIDKIAN